MTPRLHRAVHLAAATVLVVTAAGCSADTTTKPVETTTKPKATPTSTHDGAVPIATVTSWVTAMRDGNGDIACGFGTPAFQKSLAVEAAEHGAAPQGTSCPKAVAALSETRHAPRPVTEFVVESALDETTVLTLKHKDSPTQTATVTNIDGTWLIDAITTADK